MFTKNSTRSIIAVTVFTSILAVSAIARTSIAQRVDQEPNTKPDETADAPPAASTAGQSAAKPAAPKLPEPKGAKRLSSEYDVWVDPKEKAVIVDGQISLREGMLEMFACIRNTKEHESVVSANTKAYIVHAALVTLGAEPGQPAQWRPSYKPPTGTEIEITVYWLDENGKEQTTRAQQWVKDIRTGKAMTHPWVFAGSRFWTDEETGTQHYMAEGGDFICVSNFSTAMLDIPIESSQSNAELAFEAFAERIPPLGAPVRLILKPKLKEQDTGAN
ncbi:MAG TPA: YdjY domain-containing protein [Pirellulales bacterium]|nr:YdjY domain-containing protein [Pirellulales bacterium]